MNRHLLMRLGLAISDSSRNSSNWTYLFCTLNWWASLSSAAFTLEMVTQDIYAEIKCNNQSFTLTHIWRHHAGVQYKSDHCLELHGGFEKRHFQCSCWLLSVETKLLILIGRRQIIPQHQNIIFDVCNKQHIAAWPLNFVNIDTHLFDISDFRQKKSKKKSTSFY